MCRFKSDAREFFAANWFIIPTDKRWHIILLPYIYTRAPTNDNIRTLTSVRFVKSYYPIGFRFRYSRSCFLFTENTGRWVSSVTARYALYVFSIWTVCTHLLSLMHCEKKEKKEKAKEIVFLITTIRNIHWLRSTHRTILKLLNKSCSLIESNCST